MIPAVSYVSIQQQPGKYEEMNNINRNYNFCNALIYLGTGLFSETLIVTQFWWRLVFHPFTTASQHAGYWGISSFAPFEKGESITFSNQYSADRPVIACSPLSCAACTRLLKQWFGKIMWTKEVLVLIWCPHLNKDMYSLLEWHMLWKFSGIKNYEKLMW